MNEITEQWLLDAGFHKQVGFKDAKDDTDVVFRNSYVELNQFGDGSWWASVDGGFCVRLAGCSTVIARGGESTEPPQSTTHVQALCYALGIPLNIKV